MKKAVAEKLTHKANLIAEKYSNADRDFNFSSETFKVCQIMPLSEFTAGVVFMKSSGKKAVAFFYWINQKTNEGGYWNYFFPTDSHLLGMQYISRLKGQIEAFNFPQNFDT